MTDWAEFNRERREWLGSSGRRALELGNGARTGWSPIARLQMMEPDAEKHPETITVRGDGTLGIKVTCRSCRLESVLWCEHEEQELGDGVTLMGATYGRVPVAAIRFLQVWCCESCSAAEEAATARVLVDSESRKRLEQSRIPRGIAEAVSWETMLAKGGDADETIKRQRAIDVCREWATHPRPKHALLLYGPPGAGKTRLAATTAVARLGHSPITWVSVAVLMAELDAAWSDAAREEALRVLTARGPVVLDDLDKITGGVRHKQFLYTALDRREQSGERAIIMTANGKPSELEKLLGDVLMSRIAGMCHSNAGMLAFPGPDRRLELGEEA